MVFFKYRVREILTDGSAFTGNFQVGPDTHAAGDAFFLSQKQAEEWITRSDIALGYLELMGEAQEDQAFVTESAAYAHAASGGGPVSMREYFDGATPGAQRGIAQELEPSAINIILPLVVQRTSSQTGVAYISPPYDCVINALEFTDLDKTMLGNVNYSFNINTIPKGTETAVEVFETNDYAYGTRDQLPTHVTMKTGVSHEPWGGNIVDQTVAAAGPRDGSSGTVDLGMGASGAEFLYVGWHDRFDGIYFDIDTVNSAGATAAVEYPQITSSGTVNWTDVNTLADGTANSTVTFANDGAMTWNRPGDWGQLVVASGSGEFYYVRVRSAGVALTAAADAYTLRIITRKIRPYDNDQVIESGDQIRFDSVLDATGGATEAATGATLTNCTLWLSRVK